MPRALSITSANVTEPNGTVHEKVLVAARGRTFVVRRGRGRTASTLVLDESVQAVRYLSKQRWEVDTDAGTFAVVDLGCGCR